MPENKETAIETRAFARQLYLQGRCCLYTTLTKIETGVIKKPSVFVVSKITKALDVAIEDLIK